MPDSETTPLRETAIDVFLSDEAHPDWTDYLATNLRDALDQVPDTGDWHGALRSWCERAMSGRMIVNRTGKPWESQ